jgi:hypothetical protein
MDMFVYSGRTTSGNKILKKQKTGADKDDLVRFFKKKKFTWKMKASTSQILSHSNLAKNAISHVIYSSGAGAEPFF